MKYGKIFKEYRNSLLKNNIYINKKIKNLYNIYNEIYDYK